MDQNYENEAGNGKKTLWIIGGIILVIMIIALVYGATQKNLSGQADQEPVRSDAARTTVPAKSQTQPAQAVSGASDRVSVTPSISSMDLVNLETVPYQAQARIQGTVPDGCSEFDQPAAVRTGNVITVSVTASHARDATCSQAATKRSTVVDLPVAGLDDGKYVVRLGTISRTLEISSAKASQYTGDK